MAVALAVALTVVACASSTSVATAADPAAEPTTSPEGGDNADPAPAADRVIGSANMNGEVVGPQPHLITGYSIAESYPEQVAITFTAGDPNCLAADATATAAGDQVIVALRVGITTDAMARSCQAKLFDHQLSLPLTEGLDGREVVLEVVDASASNEDGAIEPPPQDFASTLIGMSDVAAQEGAESLGYRWRVMSLDGEGFAGTTDYDEQRVNVAIEDGIVVDAWLG